MDDAITNKLVKKLSEMPAARLVKIIQAALSAMEDTEQTDFIAKYIDARTSLTRLGADNPAAFLAEVENFSQDCLNGGHYSNEDDIEAYFSGNRYRYDDYDDDWDYGEYYSNTEWADTFGRLFKLSMMYIQSGDYETGYQSASQLLSCLKELASGDRYLGTDEPMLYIGTDWNELFPLYYEALFKHCPDSDLAVKTALRCWVDFGAYCDEGFLSNVKDTAAARRWIIEEIAGSTDWAFQRKSFDLLVRLHDRLGTVFDRIALAKELMDHNVYFFLPAVESLCENGRWQEAVETACTALTRIRPALPQADCPAATGRAREQAGVIAEIRAKLTDAYEQLSNFVMAFETVKQMFYESPSFALYQRARVLSEKAGGTSPFLAAAEELLMKEKRQYMFSSEHLLRDIYSYEGETVKLMSMATAKSIETNYYDQKYIALSLIYRAFIHTPEIGGSLPEYLSAAAGEHGISDMLRSSSDGTPQTELLLCGTALLREIIAFHINAATRNRYAKAAYYMCVVRDIFIHLKREDDFRLYFQGIMQQNSRRPALRDEMRVVYGEDAVTVKKRH